MHQTMRWFGPNDPVKLSDIRQAGCAGVVTALHHIPPGHVWSITEINIRKFMIGSEGMTWTVVESLPVSEAIKTQSGDYKKHIANYCQSLRNLAACGIKVITYNFMPVLDWVRTDVNWKLPDGARALYFEKNAFIAFDLFLLRRPGAEKDYTKEEIRQAKDRFDLMREHEKQTLFANALLGLPGSDVAFTPQQVLNALETYREIDADRLRQHLFYFLQQVIPVAEELNLQMAIHPDDPPYPVLGLPRVVSTEEDIAAIISAAPSSSNGLCFCTGSLGVRPENDLLAILRRFNEHIHFLHLRNTAKDGYGNFYEATHLGGDTDMFLIVKEILQIQRKLGKSLPMRPDHGHQMLDDLDKKTYPGYSAIGRLKGLAELRGLELGVYRWMLDQ
ncbi:MAG: mannonate dehydratase [Chitinophagaceae bacterium]|nr:mannonate dehydratase [Chitinophagaceae bacterium]